MTTFESKLQMGRLYLRTWPREKVLAPMFPENRVIQAVEMALKVVPLLVIVSTLIQLRFGHPDLWPMVMATILFMVSLPLQGYYWLGMRAETRLPPTLARWYFDINDKLGAAAQSVFQPRFMDLARTLRLAFEKLDDSFLYP